MYAYTVCKILNPFGYKFERACGPSARGWQGSLRGTDMPPVQLERVEVNEG